MANAPKKSVAVFEELTDDRLTDKQRAFVFHYVAGAKPGDAVAAARAANYAEASASAATWNIMRLAHIQTAIREANRRMIGDSLATKAISVLHELLHNPTTHPKLRFEAAKTVLDRAGYVAPKDAGEHERGKRPEDMSLDELESFIRRGREAMRQADKPQIEGTLAPDVMQGDGQVTDIIEEV